MSSGIHLSNPPLNTDTAQKMQDRRKTHLTKLPPKSGELLQQAQQAQEAQHTTARQAQQAQLAKLQNQKKASEQRIASQPQPKRSFFNTKIKKIKILPSHS